MPNDLITIKGLGQSGLLINHDQTNIIVDPYLSNSVEIIDSKDYKRLIPIPILPEEVKDINYILITHEHIDHCDPHTIPKLSIANPNAIFIGPKIVRENLLKWGIRKEQIIKSKDEIISLSNTLSLKTIPAAHPQIKFDDLGQPLAVGWLIVSKTKKVYISGDTSLCDDVIDSLKPFSPIDLAILPVNEDNYFRRKVGIIGNMSIREAFGFAEEIQASRVAPVHWDMFESNSTNPEEIISVYNCRNWSFSLLIDLKEIRI